MKSWLMQHPGRPRHSFDTVAYSEREGWDSAGAQEIMARLLATSTASDETARIIAERTGRSEESVRDDLVVKRQPKNELQRMGKFGEVLHAHILEAFQGMTVVTKKYMYNPAPNAPVHGIDLVAIGAAEDGTGERIVYAETKLRTVRDGAALVRAHAALAKINDQEIPDSLVAEVVCARERDPDMFMRLVNASTVLKNAQCRIGAIFEESAWSDSYLERLDRVHSPGGLDMVVDIVKIKALHSLVCESYGRVK